MDPSPTADASSRAISGRALRPRVLVGVALLLCFVGLTNHGLWIPDEPRVADTGRAMLASGDLVVPRVGGRPFLEYPPLAWWLMLPSLLALGPNAAGARLPVGFACAAAVLLVADLTRLMAGRRAGGAAALVVATTGGVAWYGHRCVVDPWLMAAVTFGLWSLARALRPFPADDAVPAPGRPRAGWLVLAYVGAGLAFLVKGPVGLVLLGGPGLALVLLLGRPRAFFCTPAHLAGLACLVALTATWPLLLYARGGQELVTRFLMDTAGKRVTDVGDGAPEHDNGFALYFIRGPLLALPWSLTLPAVVAWLRSRPSPAGWSRRGLVAVGVALPVGMTLLTIPASKRAIYLLPLLPTLAPLVGAWLVATRDDPRWLDRATLLALLVACPVLLVGGLALALIVHVGVPAGPQWVRALEGAFPGWALVALVLASLVALGLAGLGLRCWRARSPSTGTLALLGAALVTLTHHAVLYPALDPSRGTGPLASFVRRSCGAAPTFAYMLDETTVALASFEAGVEVEWSWDARELRDFVASRPGGRVILHEPIDGLIPDDVRQALRLRERWVASRRRVYVVYDVPAPKIADEQGT